MKRITALCLMLLIFGCSYGTHEIKTLVTDQQYVDYKGKLDSVEKSYLNGEITYAQYLNKKAQIQDDYDRVIKDRQEKIHNDTMGR